MEMPVVAFLYLRFTSVQDASLAMSPRPDESDDLITL